MTMLPIPVAVPLARLGDHCEQFTKEFVWGAAPVSVTVEAVSPELGAQWPLRAAVIRGISYEPQTKVLELSLEDGDHRISGIQEVWLAVQQEGSVELIEAVQGEGRREILTLSRARRAGSCHSLVSPVNDRPSYPLVTPTRRYGG